MTGGLSFSVSSALRQTVLADEHRYSTPVRGTFFSNTALVGFAFKRPVDSIGLIGFVPSKLFLLILLGLSALSFER
jgi:hypothetical protein